LQSVTAHKCGLHGVKAVVIRQAFNGGDLIAGMHHRKREAAIDALPVDNHCAGAALPLIASLLGACEPEMFTQRIQQCRSGVECKRVGSTINLKSDCHQIWRRFGI
jgi:hypothetical protein